MKTFLAPLRCLVPALMILAMAAPGHAQLPLATPAVPELVQPASADCGAIGRSVAASEGGTVRSAVAESSGGRTVCVIVYTVPGTGGQPPRVVRKQVPAN
ncbi:hypothetical protein EJC49_06485 [Aquibium carbonis]|uniref:Uncharacterized protein n=1 Tax=Aquibium carbonis TaxID=2495581 RepID=A0A3R9Y9J8_9HYPH|nr:hypothetical protein [Aquibium carbonis]RST87216.1 hypothetical protein EJC49_06485 [Aquibium carbonis]